LPLIFLFALPLFNQPLMVTLAQGQINFVLASSSSFFSFAGPAPVLGILLDMAGLRQNLPVLFVLPFITIENGNAPVFALSSAGLLAASILVSGFAPGCPSPALRSRSS
jgi:hypothetical protein